MSDFIKICSTVLELQQADSQILRRKYENSCPTDINDFWRVRNYPDPFGSVEDEAREQTDECRPSYVRQFVHFEQRTHKMSAEEKMLKQHVLLHTYDVSFIT
jgi:hypothetical protein